MLLNEIFGELIKHDLQKNRGKNLKKIVKIASRRADIPNKHPYVSGAPEVNLAKQGDLSNFSGMF